MLVPTGKFLKDRDVAKVFGWSAISCGRFETDSGQYHRERGPYGRWQFFLYKDDKRDETAR